MQVKPRGNPGLLGSAWIAVAESIPNSFVAGPRCGFAK
jgi:hypothetical protein